MKDIEQLKREFTKKWGMDTAFVEWLLKFCPYIIGKNGAGKIIGYRPKDGTQKSLAELYNEYLKTVKK